MSVNNKEFKIKFRGVRGSHPVCSKNQLEYGGNTSCVELRVNGRTIVFDGGTGIISLGNDLVRDYIASGTDIESRKPIETIILFSHSHLDHILGMPFFKPAYIKTSDIKIFGPRTRGKDFEQLLTETIFSSVFPIELKEMSAKISVNNIHESEVILIHPDKTEPEVVWVSNEKELNVSDDTIVISSSKCYAHPKDGVLLYKIQCNGKSVVYATDKEGYVGGDSKLTAFARNTSLLIHDSQFTIEEYTSPVTPRQGFGHSTPEMAIEAAKLVNAQQLVLFHLDPNYDDNTLKKMEEKAKGAFYNTVMAYEGLEIDLMKVKCRK